MDKKKEQIVKEKLETLIKLYEEKPELAFLKEMSLTAYDTSKLPSVIKSMVELAIKRTAFPTVSSLAIANFTLSHLFGQLRPKIVSNEYSPDTLGINTYTIVISRSGSSKDRTYNSLSKAACKALEYIENKKKIEAEETAKAHYIKINSKTDPDFDPQMVTRDDWEIYIKPAPSILTDLQASRGGITSDLNKIAKSKYGVTSLFDSEFALAVQTSENAVDIFKLVSVLYDNGKSVAPSFKSDEAKEESVDDAFMNMLGVTSAAPFYERGGRVRKILVPLLMTSLARRTTVVYNSSEEEFTNEYVPLTPEEDEALETENESTARKLQLEIDDNLLEAVKTIEKTPTISMDVETGKLYKMYRRYTKNKAKLILLNNGESSRGLELAGQAFKMFRIAAVWTMAQNKTVVNKQTLEAAIEFSAYTAEHLERFNKTLQLTEYELFVQDWKEGFLGDNVPVDVALTNGYITAKQVNKQSMENFLRPVNSKLTGEAVVSFDENTNCFVFTKMTKNTENLYGYRVVSGISDDRPVPKAITRELDKLSKPLVTDSSINPFVEDTTKLVMLTVDKAILSMDKINHYLANTTHWIATKKDKTDEHSYTIILPVNIEINKEDYKFVTMSIAEQLLLKVKPEDCEPETIHHGYRGAVQLTSNEDSSLFDVSGILANVATSTTTPRLNTKTSVKPTPSAINKFVTTEIEDNLGTIIEIVDISSTPLLFLASLAYTMKCKWVTDDQILEIINNVNSSVKSSYSEEVIQEFVIEPFKGM